MNGVPNEHGHWQQVYEERDPDEVSWFEQTPERSLAMIEGAVPHKDAAIIDVGGGASRLAGELLRRGYGDITIADISAEALEQARRELGERADEVVWVQADVRDQAFGRRFDLWHDRAVFHFMVDDADREAYLATLRDSVSLEGQVIIATFGPEGPEQCSGLPVRRYGADELAAQLGPQFDLVDSELGVHETPSGYEQQFLWAHFRAKDAPTRS
jgi:SAM-dependent methyltransferase